MKKTDSIHHSIIASSQNPSSDTPSQEGTHPAHDATSNTDLPKIPVGISACVMGQSVRYNGGHKRSRFCTDILSDRFDFRPFCPEVGIGMGIPRPAIRLVGNPERPDVVGTNDDTLNVTDELYEWSDTQAQQLDDLCGYVFIKNSPSCGAFKVKVYNNDKNSNSYGYPQETSGIGVFAKAVMKYNPLIPIEEEGRLNDAPLRENFILRVFALHRWKSHVMPNLSHHAVELFHREYKYTLMAHSQAAYKKLGQWVATGHKDQPLSEFAQSYISEFMAALSSPASRKNHCNVLQHILGYLKRSVSSTIRLELLGLIESYRTGNVHLIVPVTMLKHYVEHYGNDYIKDQAYLNPYPMQLGLRNNI